MYNPDNDIEIRYSTKHLPIEYKLLEWRLIINRELYEDKVIDLEVFSEMEKSILGRMTKIRNEYKNGYFENLLKQLIYHHQLHQY